MEPREKCRTINVLLPFPSAELHIILGVNVYVLVHAGLFGIIWISIQHLSFNMGIDYNVKNSIQFEFMKKLNWNIHELSSCYRRTHQLVLVFAFNTSFHAPIIWSRFLDRSSDIFVYWLRFGKKNKVHPEFCCYPLICFFIPVSTTGFR